MSRPRMTSGVFSNHMSSCRQRLTKLDDTQTSHSNMSSRGGRGHGGYYRELYGGRGRGSKSNGTFAKIRMSTLRKRLEQYEAPLKI